MNATRKPASEAEKITNLAGEEIDIADIDCNNNAQLAQFAKEKIRHLCPKCIDDHGVPTADFMKDFKDVLEGQICYLSMESCRKITSDTI